MENLLYRLFLLTSLHIHMHMHMHIYFAMFKLSILFCLQCTTKVRSKAYKIYENFKNESTIDFKESIFSLCTLGKCLDLRQHDCNSHLVEVRLIKLVAISNLFLSYLLNWP